MRIVTALSGAAVIAATAIATIVPAQAERFSVVSPSIISFGGADESRLQRRLRLEREAKERLIAKREAEERARRAAREAVAKIAGTIGADGAAAISSTGVEPVVVVPTKVEAPEGAEAEVTAVALEPPVSADPASEEPNVPTPVLGEESGLSPDERRRLAYAKREEAAEKRAEARREVAE